jgi:hypothetical protein
MISLNGFDVDAHRVSESNSADSDSAKPDEVHMSNAGICARGYEKVGLHYAGNTLARFVEIGGFKNAIFA